jgi:nucleotide-binding universal stress UspA family protein
MRFGVAVDIQDGAEHVLAAVLPLARRMGATLDVLYASTWAVETPPSSYPSEALTKIRETWDAHAEGERTRLEALVLAHAQPERGDQAVFLRGRPLDVLPEALDDYDLAVVGTHGRRGMQRMLLGSVAARVVRSCQASVLVLGAKAKLEGEPLVVLAPIDLQGDAGALPHLARLLGSVQVHAVHVLRVPPLPAAGDFGRRTAEAASRQLVAEHGHAQAQVRVLDHTGGNVGDQLVIAAEAVRADVVAMPTHGRTGLRRLTLGSVAERVVQCASCAVLVTRPT